jgi:hypothetical protein
MTPEQAMARAKADTHGQDALHGPDQVAGGNPQQFTGMGDAGVNRSPDRLATPSSIIRPRAGSITRTNLSPIYPIPCERHTVTIGAGTLPANRSTVAAGIGATGVKSGKLLLWPPLRIPLPYLWRTTMVGGRCSLVPV